MSPSQCLFLFELLTYTCIGKVDECNVILIGRVYGWWTSIELRYLLLSFYRRGIGWHLLKASEELISQMSSSREVYLHCRMIDTAPLNMYRKAGYTIVETDNIFILLTLQRRKHLMCKVLPDSESLFEVDEYTSSADTWTCIHRQLLRYIIFHGQALFHLSTWNICSLGCICSLFVLRCLYMYIIKLDLAFVFLFITWIGAETYINLYYCICDELMNHYSFIFLNFNKNVSVFTPGW